MRPHLISRRIAAALGAMALPLLVGNCGDDGPGNGGPVGDLIVQLEWTAPGNLDVGATTPGNLVVAANYSAPDADTKCTHTGDELGTGTGVVSERMTCNSPSVGLYDIVVENYSAMPATASYMLFVTVGGQSLPGYPVSGTIDANQNLGNGGDNRHTFTVGRLSG